MHDPMFRAAWSKFTIATLKRWQDPERARLLAAVGGDLRAAIRSASSLGWHDASVFMALCGRIAACGDEVARRFWRYSLRESTKQPLIYTLVRGGIALWGETPVALYARTPRAWALASKDCGEMDFVHQAGEVVLAARGLPAVCRSHLGLVRMWEGGFAGQADAVFCTAHVTADLTEFAHSGNVSFRLRWEQMRRVQQA